MPTLTLTRNSLADETGHLVERQRQPFRDAGAVRRVGTAATMANSSPLRRATKANAVSQPAQPLGDITNTSSPQLWLRRCR